MRAEGVVADLGRGGDGDRLEGGALVEGALADHLDRGGEGDRLEGAAVAEGALADLLGGDDDRLEGAAAAEGGPADLRDQGEVDRLEGAALEGALADHRERGGEADRPERLAAEEGVRRHARHPLRQLGVPVGVDGHRLAGQVEVTVIHFPHRPFSSSSPSSSSSNSNSYISPFISS